MKIGLSDSFSSIIIIIIIILFLLGDLDLPTLKHWQKAVQEQIVVAKSTM
jgi:Sec-independent protein translocase protein TatA